MTNSEEISTVSISGLSYPVVIMAALRAANEALQSHEMVGILKRARMLRTVPKSGR